MRSLPSLRPALCRGELRKVNKTQTIRFGSARYSLPTGWVGKLVEVSVVDHEVVLSDDGREIDRHPLMAPGEVSIKDEHYQGRTRLPTRAVRIRTETERAFLALGSLSLHAISSTPERFRAAPESTARTAAFASPHRARPVRSLTGLSFDAAEFTFVTACSFASPRFAARVSPNAGGWLPGSSGGLPGRDSHPLVDGPGWATLGRQKVCR